MVAPSGTWIADEEGRMKMRMLIGYASRFGSTRDIAIRIAGIVQARGTDVDVLGRRDLRF